MKTLNREQFKEAMRKNIASTANTYKDIFSDRYILGENSENWQTEGAKYDERFGGDWMPLSVIAFYKIQEEAMYGTYCGNPV